MYIFKPASRFKRQYKKLSQNDEVLDPKHKDHKLTGQYDGFRECHIKPDLLLIYKKEKRISILICLAIGSHSELF